MLFEQVEKAHIEKAVIDFEKNGLPKGYGKSIYYDVEINKKRYPPKAIMAYAYLNATGEEVKRFKGGLNTDCFNALESLGYKILVKTMNNLIIEFIEKYKLLIQNKIESSQYNELYKWETIQHFQDHWPKDINEHTIQENLKDSFYGESNNLWSGSHYLPFKMMRSFAEKFPREVADMYNLLFDETKDLDERCERFEKTAEHLRDNYFSESGKQHYQGRRAMMVYLTLKYPDRYYFYQNKLFNKFCEITRFREKPGKGKKYNYTILHEYMDMCDEVKAKLLSDQELLNIHVNRLPEHINFNDDHNLLTQDFIYSVTTYLNLNEDDKVPNDEVRLKEYLGQLGIDNSLEFYKVIDHLVSHLGLTKNDKRVCYNLPSDKKIGITIGQKYCVIVKVDKAPTIGYINTIKDKVNWYNQVKNWSALNEQLDIIKISSSQELERTKKSGFLEHSSAALEKSIFDSKYRQKILSQLSTNIENNSKKIDAMDTTLNEILYGPPGTGKTYSTINKALEICGENISSLSRKKINELFNHKIANGQIVFTTFHQSMSYEDFIEGIKPVMSTGDEENLSEELNYRIENGILKEFAEQINDENSFVASSKDAILIPKEKFEESIVKISLGNSLVEEDDAIYEYCIENNCIAIGFGEDIDFSGAQNRADIRNKYKLAGIEFNSSMDFNISAIERFVIWLKKGQLIFVSEGTTKLKAIGQVEGDYYCDSGAPIRYSQFRKVKWLYTDLEIPIKEIYYKKFSQQTIYFIDPKHLNQEFFSQNPVKSNSNYVLIIDEINRGNVSQIFGELITLIEEDKRLGNNEALKVRLPYSKKLFGLPKNLHIIGTMNTADRSVEALDTALRRRFEFTEVMPNSDIIRELVGDNGTVAGYDIAHLLDVINKRIEVLVDRDHTIGHSYFLEVSSLEDLKLVFKNKVIPLLQEYFYGDYGKIGLVLGKGFVERIKRKTDFADINYDGIHEFEGTSYDLIPINEQFNIEEALNHLLKVERFVQ